MIKLSGIYQNFSPRAVPVATVIVHRLPSTGPGTANSAIQAYFESKGELQ
jgi:hypothetical protein